MTNEYKGLLEQVLNWSTSYIEQIPVKAVFPTSEDLQGLSTFNEPLPNDGTDAADVLEMLHHYGSPATTAQSGGRYCRRKPALLQSAHGSRER